jgi:hypothetical protein
VLFLLAEIKDDSGTYWTSASNEGFGCENKWNWCTADKLLPSDFTHWKPNEPSHPFTERCMDMWFNTDPKKLNLNDKPCQDGIRFVCEVSEQISAMKRF